jgi:hypothetical protein
MCYHDGRAIPRCKLRERGHDDGGSAPATLKPGAPSDSATFLCLCSGATRASLARKRVLTGEYQVPCQGYQARTCYYLLASFAVLGVLAQGKGKKPGTWREENTGGLGSASAAVIGYYLSPLCRLGPRASWFERLAGAKLD